MLWTCRYRAPLPSHIDAGKVEASAKDGVPQVRVPKAKEMQAKRIEVRAGNGHAVPGPATTAQDGR